MPLINIPEGLAKSEILRSDLIKLIIDNVNLVIEPSMLANQTQDVLDIFGKNSGSPRGIDGDNLREEAIDRRNIAKNAVTKMTTAQTIFNVTTPIYHPNPFDKVNQYIGHSNGGTAVGGYVTGIFHKQDTGNPSLIGVTGGNPLTKPEDTQVDQHVSSPGFNFNDATYNYSQSSRFSGASNTPSITIDGLQQNDVVMVYCSFSFIVFPLDNDAPLANTNNGPHHVRFSLRKISVSSPFNYETIRGTVRNFSNIGSTNVPGGGFVVVPNSNSCTIVSSFVAEDADSKTVELQAKTGIGRYNNYNSNDTLCRIESFNMFHKVLKGAKQL